LIRETKNTRSVGVPPGTGLGNTSLDVGIMAGCTICPLAFTMAMEVIIRASRWVVGGERLDSGMRLLPIRAYMDDMTTMTTTVACTNRLLGRLTDNIEWARIKAL